MKKLMTIAAALVVGAAFADMESSIVGYTTATINKGNYKAFAVHFSNVGAPAAPIAINNLVTVTPLSTAPTFGSSMDQIWRWDSANVCWAKYGYQKPARSGTAAWRKYNASTGAFSELTEADVVSPGETFLYFRGNNGQGSFTLSGAVKEFSASPQYTINKGNYAFVARPWPIGFRLSDINEIATWSALATAPTFGSSMDQIWRWDSANVCWAKYGYQKPARSGTAAWRKYNASTGAFTELTDEDAIADNEGFLYFRGNNAALTLTFKALQPAE